MKQFKPRLTHICEDLKRIQMRRLLYSFPAGYRKWGVKELVTLWKLTSCPRADRLPLMLRDCKACHPSLRLPLLRRPSLIRTLECLRFLCCLDGFVSHAET